ncbi:MAG: hypothetical protein KA100_05790 [Rickettsiales bacterium]|nr:hypothetical protein [Rickettsiales bacterium]
MKKIIGVVAVLILSYVGFWFFKSHQISKEISLGSESQSFKHSAADVAVSGFPLAHKVVIKDLKFTDEKSGEIIFKKLEVESGVFSSSYSVKVLEPIEFMASDHQSKISIILNADTQILATEEKETNGLRVKYSSSGYKVLDATSNILFSSEMQNGEGEILLSEKSGSYKYKDLGGKILDKANNVLGSSAATNIDLSFAEGDNKSQTIKFNLDVKDFAKGSVAPDQASADKSNFAIAGEVALTANDQKITDLLPPDQMAKLPENMKASFQKKPAPYSFALNLQNLEFSNTFYKVVLNAVLNTSQEDEIPSGVANLKIENFDNLVKTLTDEMQKVKDQGKSAKIAAQLEGVNDIVKIVKELGAKNPQSTEGAMLFTFKRDKGLGFNLTINDMQLLEIMTQMVPQGQKGAISSQQ